MNKRLNRLKEVDILRAIGIILVVISHLLKTNSYLYKIIFSFHMPLFFLVSGFCVSEKLGRKKFLPFLKQKAISLLIPSIIFVNLWHLFHYGATEYFAIIKNNPLFYVIPANEWFLTSFFASSILLWLYVKIENKIKHRPLEIVLFIMVFVVAVTLALYPEIQPAINNLSYILPFRLGTTLIGFSFQLIGYIIRNKTKAIDVLQASRLSLGTFIGTILMGSLLLIYIYFDTGVNIANMAFGLSLPLFYINGVYWYFLVYWTARQLTGFNWKINDLFVFIGLNAMYIYLGHGLLSRIFKIIAFKLWGVSWEPMINLPKSVAFIYFCLYFILLLPVIYLFREIQEKFKHNTHSS